MPYTQAVEDPAVIARGRYIVYGPGRCADCHSPDAERPRLFRGEQVPLTGGSGESTYLGTWSAPNLTPDPKSSPLAAWDEATFLARFRGGKVFAGTHMPWENFAELTDADVRSLYRYLRSLPPVSVAAGPSHRPAGWKPAGS